MRINIVDKGGLLSATYLHVCVSDIGKQKREGKNLFGISQIMEKAKLNEVSRMTEGSGLRKLTRIRKNHSAIMITIEKSE